ncbi:LuxR C-terminal-related transcriptional regulator [Streptomyces sp. UH6]|uniref:LuxR C-terminal-related transcriptional regulator n=1 Tax=Streptomyces sp. UH6 TaxID=2748379 RepID=UPI0015D4A9D4|nr:hypothetical protein [Streptomyces sp. UH6]NYV76182.1 hypothetical protein [Streptomyces sp. UH6]
MDATALASSASDVLRDALSGRVLTLLQDHTPLQQLVSLGLLRRTPGGFVPVAERIAHHAVADALSHDLEERALAILSLVRSQPDPPGPATVSSQAVLREIARARRDVLVALPGAIPPDHYLQSLAEVSRAVLARRARVKVLCQHPARYNESVKSFVRRIDAPGGEIRTLDDFFNQLVVVDGSTAFLLTPDLRTRSTVVTDPVTVSFLVDLYERHWTRAAGHPFRPTHAARAAGDVSTPFRKALIQMLIDGHPDKHISKKLGLSQRSTAEHVARLKAELGAKNRTEMGYLLAKRELGASFPPAEALGPPVRLPA